MIVYQNGPTYHLYPECRGVYGKKTEIRESPGAPDPNICGMCMRRKGKEGRINLALSLKEQGLSFAEIGRQWGVSRQAVFGLVKEG